MPREPERTIMSRQGNPGNAAMSASAWDTAAGTVFSALRRLYLAIVGVVLARTVVGKAVASVATADLFTISGGPIKVLGFVGLITTVVETKANNTKIQFTPTGGAATDLCAVLDVSAAAAGKFFTITGTKANAMAVSTDAGIVVANLASPLTLSTGTVKMTCADTSTGAITWYMVYEPMDPSAAVAAA